MAHADKYVDIHMSFYSFFTTSKRGACYGRAPNGTQQPGGDEALGSPKPGGGEALGSARGDGEALGGARRMATLGGGGCSAAPKEARRPKAGGLKERRAGQ